MKPVVQIIFFILAFACGAYGTAVRGVGSGNRFFLVWWMGAAVFVLLAAALRFGWFARIPRPLLYLCGAAFAAGCIWVTACTALVLSHFHDRAKEEIDVVIVLGAQVHPSGPSIILQHRLDTAAEVLGQYPEAACIVSGGQGENEHAPEAHVMRDYLVMLGVDAGRIRTEDASKNTIGNIENCLKLIDAEEDRVGIITNDFHLFRALSIAKKQGIRHVTGIAAPSRAFFYPHNILRECVGILKDKLLGNL